MAKQMANKIPFHTSPSEKDFNTHININNVMAISIIIIPFEFRMFLHLLPFSLVAILLLYHNPASTFH
ncbi:MULTISPECIES: hypothetical protein [Rossellomorea]|jgi:hypothetical protein|uniref:Uncharacterized protein n=1 Tax=Rossellomorea aquimaris TaxID=189382 RepID=A0A5D4UBX5_9BACI|nr:MULTISPECIES: hypothetical protein [Rossellomorea]MDT9024084.1 hypothetical protein [Rossellomorea sp. YC4-1]TYS79046.1 hypothetical protein FZD05_11020 [Rossellomorea aquimaris]TYS84792.1 hypothetical protein FZC85_15655 [Rossellomorea aquimaris]TYS91290.1 hypothetical protein FZC88_03845 [Rossellomorea aquimaris]